MALDLLRRGWKVFASSVNVDDMENLRVSGCQVLALDVTNIEDIEAAAASIGDRLDLLINNAAVEGLGPLLDTDIDRLSIMYRTNVFGPLQIIQALSNPLIKYRGTVVNIGSVGVSGLPFHGAYASSKAALQVISDVLRRETVPLGVNIITVELGMVMTAMLRAEDPFPVSLPEGQRLPYYSKWYSHLAARYRSDIEKRYNEAMPASEAARQIVDAVVAGLAGKIWAGSMAWFFRWIWPLLSVRRQDSINSSLLHLDMLSEPPRTS
ncbi:NAD(P)-binding protein [Myriangium duriaei CBS 260.36]|uniref:NAD(P)-binding protein n=1 Tax=Myriangium duriaei CBS 260.36 TaxID=1168546 RepID=A0A9P4J610_9PEZI|nr:NAD(P)-binding protein [Myriangium duriaei CBS 260.36]